MLILIYFILLLMIDGFFFFHDCCNQTFIIVSMISKVNCNTLVSICLMASSPPPLSLLETLIDPTTGQLTIFAYIAMFSPLAFVLLIRFGLNRISYAGLALLFVAYAALTGISLSFILLIYTCL